jgi:membrane protein implicated in regulation of membrane protease activity
VTSFFVGCFAFGLLFTVATFVLGAFGSSDAHGAGHGVLGSLTGSHASSHASAHANGHGENHVSPFSLSTLSAFLTWFGGAGYLLTRYSPLATLGVLLTALALGAIGGALFFTAVARYIVPRLTVMDPEEFRVQGVAARVTSTIQAGGIGEIVYTLGGTRHADGARSESSQPIERGTQVVILRMEKGIAYVEPWATFASTHQLPNVEPDAVEPSAP